MYVDYPDGIQIRKASASGLDPEEVHVAIRGFGVLVSDIGEEPDRIVAEDSLLLLRSPAI